MINSGGVTSAQGFKACGDHVGLKKKRKDLALVWSDAPCSVAATFTTNIAKGAPIIWNQQIIGAGKTVHGIVINSGQANSCTGVQGLENASRMAHKFAECMGCDATDVLLASTGLIGVQIPIDVAEAGIERLSGSLRSDEFSGACAAEAILTLDTCVKQCAVNIELDGCNVTIGAMAKGSGMVHPNMATMLSFITTDAAITNEMLQKALSASVSETYNMISVDGDTSTNDMVTVLANGLAGNKVIDCESEDFDVFCKALHKINTYLAKKIAGDGEGATRTVAVTVSGTATVEEAKKLARTVVASSLVKTALFGADPNWGRIVAALGYGGIPFNPNNLSIQYRSEHGCIAVMVEGQTVPISISEAQTILRAGEVEIVVDLHAGECCATAWGCDLSYDYVRINGTYRQYAGPTAVDFAEVC